MSVVAFVVTMLLRQATSRAFHRGGNILVRAVELANRKFRLAVLIKLAYD